MLGRFSPIESQVRKVTPNLLKRLQGNFDRVIFISMSPDLFGSHSFQRHADISPQFNGIYRGRYHRGILLPMLAIACA